MEQAQQTQALTAQDRLDLMMGRMVRTGEHMADENARLKQMIEIQALVIQKAKQELAEEVARNAQAQAEAVAELAEEPGEFVGEADERA